MTDDDPVETAIDRIARAENGDTLVAKEILEQAAIAIREVLADRKPNEERLRYLEFLEPALDQIASGYPPDKALHISTTNRPRRVDPHRSWHLFLTVGVEYNNLAEIGHASVEKAIQNVETRHFVGEDTIRSAWQEYGGLEAWKSLNVETESPADFDEDRFRELLIEKLNCTPPGEERQRIMEVLKHFPPKTT